MGYIEESGSGKSGPAESDDGWNRMILVPVWFSLVGVLLL